MKLSFTHETKLRVRYGETDQMGYCYYGCYAQYFEIGRVEAIRNLGISYKKLEEDGIMLPVADYQVKFLRPAHYDDELTIVTEITAIHGARIQFDYYILNERNKKIATAFTTLVFVDRKTMRPIPAPDFFSQLLTPFQNEK